MPLKWKRGTNPYRSNYFGILELGPNATIQLIATKADDLLRRIHGRGSNTQKEECRQSEVEMNEAKSRLLDMRSWAAEVLLVHPVPGGDSGRLKRTCSSIMEVTLPKSTRRKLWLVNLRALKPLLPMPSAEDVSWPEWEEFEILGPESPEDRRYDIQFDL